MRSIFVLLGSSPVEVLLQNFPFFFVPHLLLLLLLRSPQNFPPSSPGSNGDDFFALGLRGGRVVHRFNLGSGVATVVSERLNRSINIHTVTFGRSRRMGWLKVGE